MTPRLGIDATYALDPQPTGVAVYSQRLLRGLAGRHSGARYRWFYRPHRFRQSFAESLPSGAGRRLLWDPLVRGVDLFHGLNQRLPKRRGAWRTVVTFHDLFVMTAEYSTADFRARFTALAREAAAAADAIIAVSAFTAGQVRDLLGVEPARVHVIPHGVDPVAPASAGAREKLILHVGAIQKRKNLARLVDAFAATPPGWRLLLAGGSGYGSEEVLAAIQRSPRRADIETPGYLTPEELDRAWSRASIFAFPSLDEGFGMPVLEAMARGVPVLTSTSSALPEAAGGAAQLVDPGSTEVIAAALVDLCQNEAKRAALVAAGLRRVQSAGWDAAVDATWRVYQSLL